MAKDKAYQRKSYTTRMTFGTWTLVRLNSKCLMIQPHTWFLGLPLLCSLSTVLLLYQTVVVKDLSESVVVKSTCEDIAITFYLVNKILAIFLFITPLQTKLYLWLSCGVCYIFSLTSWAILRDPLWATDQNSCTLLCVVWWYPPLVPSLGRYKQADLVNVGSA